MLEKIEPLHSHLTPRLREPFFVGTLSLDFRLKASDSCGLVQENRSSTECKKVVSDIFGEIEFLMEYENTGL